MNAQDFLDRIMSGYEPSTADLDELVSERKREGLLIEYKHGDIVLEGFRESEGSVRAFRFGSTNDSYASRRGKGRNVGVIGVALFQERGTGAHWTAEEVNRRETADPFPNRFAPPPPPVGYRAY